MVTNKSAHEFLKLLEPGQRIASSNDLSAEECALFQGRCDLIFFVDQDGYGWAILPKGYVPIREREAVAVPR